MAHHPQHRAWKDREEPGPRTVGLTAVGKSTFSPAWDRLTEIAKHRKAGRNACPLEESNLPQPVKSRLLYR
jgi:hypothetical protein